MTSLGYNHILNSLYENKKAILYWGIAALFCFYEVVLRVCPSGITDTLMCDFGLTCTDLGFMIGAYYWTYSFLQIPCGFFVDKFGSRSVIALSSLICALGVIFFAATTNVYLATLARLFVGMGSACGFIAALKVAAEWFPKHLFPFFAALTNMMGTFGGNFAGKPLTILMNEYSWVSVFYALGVIGFFISAIAFFFMKDKHKEYKTSLIILKQNFLAILKNSQIWIAGLIGGICYLPITALAELWGAPFLMTTFNVSNEQGAIATNLIFIGTAIGSPVFAMIASYLGSYKKAIQITAISSFVLLVLFAYSGHFSLYASWGILFFLGFVIGGQVLVFSIVNECVPQESSGVALGLLNSLISFFAMVFQPFLGFILDMAWDGQLSSCGIRLYDAQAYRYAMLTLPLMSFLAIFIVGKIKSNE